MRRGKDGGSWQAFLRCHQLHTFLALLPCLLAFVLFGLPDVHGGGFQYGHGGGYGQGHGGGYGHGGHGGYGHGGGYGFASILNNPLIQCRLKGGNCVNINNCNTTLNIYKDICKSYNYDNVCCISRETVCHKFSGFCTNNTDFCITASKLFRRTSYYEPKKYVVLSWLACNSTHRCCHPIKGKKKSKGYGHGRSHGHGGGYGHGHGGGYGHGHGGGYGHGHGGGYGHGGGGYGHGGYGHG